MQPDRRWTPADRDAAAGGDDVAIRIGAGASEPATKPAESHTQPPAHPDPHPDTPDTPDVLGRGRLGSTGDLWWWDDADGCWRSGSSALSTAPIGVDVLLVDPAAWLRRERVIQLVQEWRAGHGPQRHCGHCDMVLTWTEAVCPNCGQDEAVLVDMAAAVDALTGGPDINDDLRWMVSDKRPAETDPEPAGDGPPSEPATATATELDQQWSDFLLGRTERSRLADSRRAMEHLRDQWRDRARRAEAELNDLSELATRLANAVEFAAGLDRPLTNSGSTNERAALETLAADARRAGLLPELDTTTGTPAATEPRPETDIGTATQTLTVHRGPGWDRASVERIIAMVRVIPQGASGDADQVAALLADRDRLAGELADARAEIAHLRREDVIGHLRQQLDAARAELATARRDGATATLDWVGYANHTCDDCRETMRTLAAEIRTGQRDVPGDQRG